MTFQFVPEIQYSVLQRIVYNLQKKKKRKKTFEDTLSEYNEPFFYEKLCFHMHPIPQSKHQEER